MIFCFQFELKRYLVPSIVPWPINKRFKSKSFWKILLKKKIVHSAQYFFLMIFQIDCANKFKKQTKIPSLLVWYITGNDCAQNIPGIHFPRKCQLVPKKSTVPRKKSSKLFDECRTYCILVHKNDLLLAATSRQHRRRPTNSFQPHLFTRKHLPTTSYNNKKLDKFPH